MNHVIDDIELYVLGALPAEERDRVTGHLAGCATCRGAAADLDGVVALLPDALPLLEPRPELKARILEAARAETARRPRVRLPWTLPRLDLRSVALAAAIALLIAVDTGQSMQLRATQAERDEYGAVAATFAHGGRTWYMAGVGDWKGIGGNLIQPSSGDPAFVVFHDLKDLPAGQTYALWLISPDGAWQRGNNFRSDGNGIQTVAVGLGLAGYDRCAVTVENEGSGKRAGPVVMQSTIAAPR